MSLIVLSPCFAAFYYVEAFRSGMSQRRWALAGALFGPLALPVFSVKRHIAMRRSRGFNRQVFQA